MSGARAVLSATNASVQPAQDADAQVLLMPAVVATTAAMPGMDAYVLSMLNDLENSVLEPIT